ncbi:hypothetical protein VTJ83DRAFT_701 [Remersonia thermophila]|uniref:Major facilitator superfamily (MFS) profile domain-containing protein n=1 Tax=Remersonia thermophila TaxID=72144 RepID=A0ABR4DLS7_9PEZI
MEKDHDPEKASTSDGSESDRLETDTTGSGTASPTPGPVPARADPGSDPGSGPGPGPGPGPEPEPEPATHSNVPDGGLLAWLQVFCSAIILVATWGVVNTFGVFQAYYESSLLSDHGASAISWIGSVQAALLFLVGVVAGPLYDAGFFRHLLAAGLFLLVLGQFVTSVCRAYWQVMLAQGVAMGVGMGLLFLPSAAILSQYFSKRRALALGLSSMGSPVAGTVFPILFSRVEARAGFGWATRTLAFILLGLSAIPLAFMRTRVPPPARRRASLDATALRDAPYVLFVAACFFSFLTLYVSFFYVSLHATSNGLADAAFAPYLVTLLNAGSVVGRVVPNALADRYGSLNLIVACTLGSAALALGWLGVRSLAGAVAFAVLYGALSGGVVSLTPSVIFTLSPDLSRVGARTGMCFIAAGVAILIGTPIAGAILGSLEDPNWTGTILYTAAGLLLATVLYATSRVLLYKKTGSFKG